MKNEQQSQNLLLKVDPRSTSRNNLLQRATNVLLRDKLITLGEKRETSTPKICNETILRDKFLYLVFRDLSKHLRPRWRDPMTYKLTRVGVGWRL